MTKKKIYINVYYLAYKIRKLSFITYNNMDKPGGQHPKWSKLDIDKHCMILRICKMKLKYSQLIVRESRMVNKHQWLSKRENVGQRVANSS